MIPQCTRTFHLFLGSLPGISSGDLCPVEAVGRSCRAVEAAPLLGVPERDGGWTPGELDSCDGLLGLIHALPL